MTPFTPDFEKYYNYINYFNGFDIEIGYGQGVIYYYLISFFLKRKIDLISKKELEDKKSKFINKIKKNVLTLSILDKKSVKEIKSKLINYVS